MNNKKLLKSALCIALLAATPLGLMAETPADQVTSAENKDEKSAAKDVAKPEAPSKNKQKISGHSTGTSVTIGTETGAMTGGGGGGMSGGMGGMGGGGGMSVGSSSGSISGGMFGGGGFGGGGGMIGDMGVWQFSRSKTQQSPLVVWAKSYDTPTKAAMQKQMAEDLPIMLRILEKSADVQRKSEFSSAMNIRLVSMPPVQRMMYLEGYGAIFFLEVPFPLLPNQNDKKAVETTPKSNSEWETAKREVLEQHDPFMLDSKPGFEGDRDNYDEQKVAQLKKGLAESLKNAANIEQLKPDEKVTVVVQSQSKSDINQPIRVVTAGKMKSGKIDIQEFGFKSGDSMTLSVQKRHAEEYLKGTLDEQKFAEKVTIDIQ